MKTIYSIDDAIDLINDFEDKKNKILFKGVKSLDILKLINKMKEEEIILLNALTDYMELPNRADDIIIQCDLISKTKIFLNKYSSKINDEYASLFEEEQYFDGEEH